MVRDRAREGASTERRSPERPATRKNANAGKTLEREGQMVFEFDDGGTRNARMKVVGVGGAGGNAVNRMIDENLDGVEFVAINTDAQALKNCEAHIRLQVGRKLTRGLGAGARPEVGRQAITESEEEVRKALEGADLVFVTAGMGGGTGTGAAPRVGQIASELGALVIAIVTRPFLFEGKKRMRHAELGLKDLRRSVDTMIVVPNERLLSVVGKGTTFREALKKADEILLHATQGISDLISVTGEVNVDFADVRTVMSNRGAALMGTGEATGENRAVEAAQQAICSPLLDNVSIHGATGILVNISGGMDLAIDEVTTINSIVQEAAGDEAEMIFGAVHDPELDGRIRVTVIATGFGDEVDVEPVPTLKVVPATPAPVEASPRLVSVAGGEPEAFDARRDQIRGQLGSRLQLEDLEIPTFIRRQMD
jgi:cell division protein FtsZ